MSDPGSPRRHRVPGEAISAAAPAAARPGAGTESPPARLLGAGSLRTLITATGSGGSWLDAQALSSWRGDRIEDPDGWFVYLRDLADRAVWSLGLSPVPGAPDRYRADDGPGSVTIARLEHGIDARMEVWVDAERAAELRTITLRNPGSEPRRIEVTSALEPVLQEALHHEAHPGFSKLFVQTECAHELLLARRRPRAPGTHHPWLGCAMRGPGALSFESDRTRFLGRGRGPDAPRALALDAALPGLAGDVLDPILALRRTVEIAPGGSARIDLVMAAGRDRGEVLAIAAGFGTEAAIERSLRGAAAAAARGPAAVPEAIARQLARAGLALHDRLPDFTIERRAGNGAGAVAPRDRHATPARRADAAAGVEAGAGPGIGTPEDEPLRAFNGWGGFSAHGDEYVIRMPRDPGNDPAVPRLPPRPWINVIANPEFGTLVSESGAACTWSRNSREFRLTPWSNDAVSDPHDEAVYVRDEASGLVWSPFPGPIPGDGRYEMRHGFGCSRCRHASHGIELETDVFVPAGDPVKVVALRVTNPGPATRRLAITSYQRLVLGHSPADAHARVTTSADPGLGILFARPGPGQAPEHADAIAFAAAVVAEGTPLRMGTDRAQVLGVLGSPRRPAAVLAGTGPDGRTGSGFDPCFCIEARLEIGPGETRTCAFLLGEAREPEMIAAIVQRLRRPRALDAAREEVVSQWAERLGRLRIETPVEAIDLMVTGWLAYQTLACRLWARAAFYQSGGAYGFRDQLQDAAALIPLDPGIAREQILLHAAQQFVEGDVLHWWHPPRGQGIRTRFADDLLWLPLTVATYVRMTGDAGVLEEVAPFLRARALAPGEDEAFLVPEPSGEAGDIYQHCCRALDRSLATGAHGLPLFGTGDWNDGMNRVGREGRGESVWMAFFLDAVIAAFLPLCERRGDRARGQRLRAHQRHLREAVKQNGWDGGWYRRGYYDDGTPLGSQGGDECRIDALVQAWSVLSGGAPRARCEQAMDAVLRELVSWREGLVRLLSPPFDRTPHDPGYIKGYLPGVRENGGQYTHAALWVVAALARLGRSEEAARVLEILSPVFHARSPAAVEAYQVEPYVVAADVYDNPQHRGRGGWTWYTGSAGWMLRVTLEEVLGVAIEEGRNLVVRPAIPADWPGYRVGLRPLGRAGTWDISVRVGAGVARVVAVRVDGRPVAPDRGVARIPIPEDGCDHRVEIDLG